MASEYAGLCGTCRHARVLKTKSLASVYLCGLSEKDPALPKYPRLPMPSCRGYAADA